MMPKKNNFGGDSFKFSFSGSGGAGASVDFESAMLNADVADYLQPEVRRGQIYGYATMTREAILACTGNDTAFKDLSKEVKDKLVKSLKRMISQQLFGDGGGSFGKLKAGSVVNTNKLYLDERWMVTFFEKGQYLQLSTTNGLTGAIEAGTVRVTAVDRANAVLTLDQVLNVGIPTATNAMWVFVRGNHYNSFGQRVITGIPGWIPRTDPAPGENFKGIDRSIDPWRYAGLRYLDGGSTIKEALMFGLALAGHEGANPTTIIVNPMDLGALAESLDNKSDTVRLQAYKADVGYDGVFLRSPTMRGRVDVIGDASVSLGDAWGLDFNDWEFRTLCETGSFPELIKMPGEGGYLERIATKDAYAVRYGGFGNSICYNPANQIYIRLPTKVG